MALSCIPMHEFLNVKEVADLLRIKERKLYDLVSEGVLPVTKVTGKLIFPRDAVMAWLRRNTDYGAALPALTSHPAVVAGSHDPLLDWALRTSGSELATYYNGSGDGLERVKAGHALAAGVHFHDAGSTGDDANARRVALELAFEPVVLIEWARRQQGLIVRPDRATDIHGIKDIAGRSVVFRQPGAGSQALFDALLNEAGVEASHFERLPEIAHNHTDMAQSVAQGDADVGFGVEAVARQHRLAFVPLCMERFDLVIWRREFFDPPIQKLLEFTRSARFMERAQQLGGYDTANTGAIRYNGP